MEKRSKLDEIEDYQFAVNQYIHKGKSIDEVTNLLLDKGAEQTEIKSIFETIHEKYKGIRLLESGKLVRGLNFIIDLLIIFVLLYFILPSFMDYNIVVIIILPLIYYTILETFFGQSVGKMITESVVVDSNGKIPKIHVTLLRSVCRFWISGIKNGFLSERIFHDKISSTYVVDKRRWVSMYETK